MKLKQNINLIYIRAAIEKHTGQRLKLDYIRQLLIEEGLISQSQAKNHAQSFSGYTQLDTDDLFKRCSSAEYTHQTTLPDDVATLISETKKESDHA